MSGRLYIEDLVALAANEYRLGIVERTHEDVDTHAPYPGSSSEVPIDCDPSININNFDTFMKDGIPPPGTVVVHWHEDGSSALIPESKLELVDRELIMGDVVKRDPKDTMSGVVINTSTWCSLNPIKSSGSAELVDIPLSELKHDDDLNEDDIVVYKDSLGRIEELRFNLSLRLPDNNVVEISEDDIDTDYDYLQIGRTITVRKGILRTGRWIYGQYNPNTQPTGTIVARRPIGAEVTWLERRFFSNKEDPPSSLDTDDLESRYFQVYDKSRLPQRSPSLSSTTSYSEIDVTLGMTVRFRDLAGASVKYDGSTPHGKLKRIDRRDTLGFDMNIFEIVNLRTDVTVQWQDLSITTQPSIDLVPDTDLDDDHAAWPGEIAHTLDFHQVPDSSGVVESSKVGVLQVVNAAERMGSIAWCDGHVQYCEATDENSPRVGLRAKVGAPTVREEISLYDVEAPGFVNVRRGDLVLLMDSEKFASSDDDVHWMGEIVDTCLDGMLLVRLGAMREVKDVKVLREHAHVAVRSDERPWDDASIHSGEETASEDLMYYSEDEYGSDIDVDSDTGATYEDENGMPLDEEEVENDDWESDVDEVFEEDQEMNDATPLTSHSTTPAMNTKEEVQPAAEPEPYLILDVEVPASHHYSSEPTTESPTHMKRLQKEHKILRSANALPNGVYVRTWESRMDLLRVLFVGPTETPYAHAPFVIDFYLDSGFPIEPPKAFFHSWTADSSIGGVGRVNPNLYEEGKICLSLLGTWDGDRGESWSPAKSTILQILVSILGLVLVREPYFNEAGYEHLVGLEGSKRPSALYSERVFLRSCGFLSKALQWLSSPPTLDSNAEETTKGSGINGLEDVLKWLYRDQNGRGLLKAKIKEIEEILLRSESGNGEPDGLSFSKGACIPLRRALSKLKEL
jgi:ubiquitin-conjugating enzyme E2 O